MKLKRVLCSIVSSVICLLSTTCIDSNAITADDIYHNYVELFNTTWVAQEDCYGWKEQSSALFKEGQRYRIPYGQPVVRGHYIGFDIVYELNYKKLNAYITCVTPHSFQLDASDANSAFYTARSDNGLGQTSLYEALDCSAFVSLCWDLDTRYICREFAGYGDPSRQKNRPVVAQELGTLGEIANNLGYTSYIGERIESSISIDSVMNYVNNLTGHDDRSLKGYALCDWENAGHIVLLAYTSFNRQFYTVAEETPPQLKRTCRTLTDTFNTYKNYQLLRLYDMEDN